MNKLNDTILPCRVDAIAESDPQRIYAEFPTSDSSYEQGFTSVSYRQLANAVNGAAWWLTETMGVGQDFETLAYSGPNDLRYPIVVLGAVKVGYKILLISPRNSLAAQTSLFNLLDCSTLIVSDPEPSHVSALTASLDLRTLKFPSLLNLLDGRHEHYTYIKTFDEAKRDPLVVVHTSGSTGLPKPLIVPHEFATRYANVHQAEPLKGYLHQASFMNGVRLIHTLPMFHAAGIYRSLISTIFSKTILITLKSTAPSSGENVGEAIKFVKADAVFLAPSQVEEVGKNSELLRQFSTMLKTIYFAGGAVSKPIGDLVASKMRLASLYGSSEMGQGAQLRALSPTTNEDWSYLRWNESLQGIEFRQEAQGLYQMIVVKNREREEFQPPFTIFPTLTEFATKDLFSPHPSIPGLWRHAGRSDDVIVLLNGEKTNPITMEGHISSHPKVRSALIAGERRLQTALLLELIDEPPMTAQGRADLIEELWPTISNANIECSAHARVTKDHIVFVKPDRPMTRAGKGTVVRQATLKEYFKEIDDLYNESDSLEPFLPIKAIEREITGWVGPDEDEDFFKLGMDSLQAIQLTRFLKARLTSLDIIVNTIYRHPSINSLTQAIIEMASNHEAADADRECSRIESISSMLERHVEELSAPAGRRPKDQESVARIKSPTPSLRILLTGSSGFVGSHVLRSLLREPSVTRIYCLNRSRTKTASKKSSERLEKLAELYQDSKVVLVTGTLCETNFGIPLTQFQELQDSVDLIIHAAWIVDFNRGLGGYDSQLEGLVKLLFFSLISSCSPTLLFVSSVSSVHHCRSPVPEEIMADRSTPASTGYGESKYVAEQLLEHAARAFGQSIMILRAGQICGPTQGRGGWNRNEWLPSLVTSSRYLGAIPASLGGHSAGSRIDWVPVDCFAGVLVELSLCVVKESDRWRLKSSRGARVFHIAHPRPIKWESLLPIIIQSLESRQRLADKDIKTNAVAVIPLREWVGRLQASSSKSYNEPHLETFLNRNPAIKLLTFYQRLASGDLTPELDTRKAQAMSTRLRDMESVRPDLMEEWVEDWLPIDIYRAG